MNWQPWRRKPPIENRETGGDFTAALTRLVEAAASGEVVDTASTAAVEAAAGALSRAFASAEVRGPDHALEAITPAVLAQIGRDLIREGASLHVIAVDLAGRLVLYPASSWYWVGKSPDPLSWTAQVTAYGPTGNTTEWVPAAGLVFARWGSVSRAPYRGVGPLSWAASTAKLGSEVERSLGDEAAGPLAQLLTIPQDGGDDDDDDDPLAMLKTDIAAARGKALLLETVAGGWGEGRTQAPHRDWMAARLGPQPPESLEKIRVSVFEHILAACGTPPALFAGGDGTAQREAFRRYLTLSVQPLARVLAAELSVKLEAPISLHFDGLHAHDLQARASSFQRLVAGGVDVQTALQTSGLLADDI